MAWSTYRLVAARENLDVRLYETVTDLRGDRGDFTVVTDKDEYPARHVVIATGFFDYANLLNAPGEDLPKVTHYYREVYPYVGQKVAVIGARNSAAKAALDCYRHGAEVTLVVRTAELSDKVKYWLKPDLENRIKEGSIRAFFNTTVQEIRPTTLILNTPDGVREIANDWVLAMTGTTRTTASSNGSGSRSTPTCSARPSTTRQRSRRRGRASTSPARCAAATARAAGSSRTAGSTRGRSRSTSPRAGRRGSISTRCTGRRKSDPRPGPAGMRRPGDQMR